MSGLPVLTLHQPWASLIALGVKTIETRSWPAPKGLIGERIGIHAALHVDHAAAARFEDVLHRGGMCAADWQGTARHATEGNGSGARGCIVATATLTDCVPMVAIESHEDLTDEEVLAITPSGRLVLAGPQRAWHWQVVTDQVPFGDFALGRYAWLLDDIKATTEWCPWCDGVGVVIPPVADDPVAHNLGFHDAECPGEHPSPPICPVCRGSQSCDPIPAKGRQGVWRWTP